MQLLPLLLSLAFTLGQTISSTHISRLCFTRGEFIYLKDERGQIKRLVKGSYPSLSPDGKTLVFSTDNLANGGAKVISREIMLIDLATSKLRSFDSLKKSLCYGGLWSPDGSKLAFAILDGEHWQVGVLDPLNGEWQLITAKLPATVGGYSLNSWTADGQSLICQDLDNIYQMDLSGKLLRKILVADVVDDPSYISSLSRFSLSANGNELLFNTEDLPDEPRLPIVWLYDLKKRTRRQLGPKTLSCYDPQWLPGGDEILFTGRRIGSRSLPAVYRIRKDGTQLELLVANAENATATVLR